MEDGVPGIGRYSRHCGDGIVRRLLAAQTTSPPRLSLVVLPFANLSNDPGQDYLGDVITEDLTRALSLLRGSTVISAGSALTLKGRTVDIKQIGRDFGVRYALEGSVLRSDGSVRINTRLVDTEALTTLWSDRFDVNRADLLRTQDEIVARLASALLGQLVQADVRRSTNEAVSNLDAEDLAMQCEASSYRLTGEAAKPSLDLCERALRIDPATFVRWCGSRPIMARASRACRAQTRKPIWSKPIPWFPERSRLTLATMRPIAPKPMYSPADTACATASQPPNAVWR